MKQRMLCKLVQVKANGSPDDKMEFSGYGAVFGNTDSYGDSIQKGAFKASLRESKKSGVWPSMLSQHGGWGLTSSDLTPIGLYDELDEDDIGLKLNGILAATPRGIEMHTLLTMSPRPAIDGLSIGYYPREWKINTSPKEGEPRRTLTRVDLIEVSLVTFPANTRARVTEAKADFDKRYIENVLRDAGISKSRAKTFISRAFADDEPRRDVESGSELLQLRTALGDTAKLFKL